MEGKKVFGICGIEEIKPNPFQPRKAFGDEQLQELVGSIQEKGILQPLVVRRKGSGYELIAGERRWRAAQKAGMKEVPIIIKDVPESELLELSLIENIQRENLNPVEEAEAFKRLMDQFHLTQEEISKRVGKDRTTITNAIRLLKLPQDIRQSLADGAISMGHARAFLSLDGPEKQRLALKKVLAGGLSVRQTENLVKRLGVRSSPSFSEKNSRMESFGRRTSASVGNESENYSQRENGAKSKLNFILDEELDRIIDLLRR